MRVFFRFFVLALIVASIHLSAEEFVWGGGNSDDFFDDASAKIEERVSGGKQPALDKLYKELYYAPIWIKNNGLSPFGRSLLGLMERDESVTQSVRFYKEIREILKTIEDLSSHKGGSLSDKVSLEMAMSKLYNHYAKYRIYGGIDWRPFEKKLGVLTEKYKIKVGWEKYAPPSNPAKVLSEALADGDLEGALEQNDPMRFQYKKLYDYLIKYIRISKHGGWGKIPRTGTLKPGRRSRIVPLIRERLSIVGDMQGCSEPMDSPKYDDCLVKAVKRFQLRHGLKGNGVVGKATRRAMSQTVTQAIQKIRLNLDRIKWLSRENSTSRMELNIPSFRLNFFHRDKLVTTIRVITGKPNHPTPSFHNKMKYIVVNPWWKIPESIVRHEMLPRLMRDPYHYEAQGKELHASWDETSERIDPGTVNWSKYQGNNKPIPYYFMQVPSRHNALGKIKFLFPNGYQVYIHDTPSKSLFFRNTRAFSHGCMRIQKPRELLESLSLFNNNIDVDGVMKRLEGTEKKTILLNHPVPIDITYLTAYVDPYGYLNFRKDVYHYDKYQMENYATKCVPLRGLKPYKVKKDTATKKEQKREDTKNTKEKKPKRSNGQKSTSTKSEALQTRDIPPREDKDKSTSISKSAKSKMVKTSKKNKNRKVDSDGYDIVEIYEN